MSFNKNLKKLVTISIGHRVDSISSTEYWTDIFRDDNNNLFAIDYGGVDNPRFEREGELYPIDEKTFLNLQKEWEGVMV